MWPTSIGDKYSDLVTTSFGQMLYAGGPVKDANGKVVGAVLVGMPLSDLLQRLTKEVVVNVTIYGPDGHALGTTLGIPISDSSLNVDSATLQKATDPKSQLSVQRPLHVASTDYFELLGQLIVGHDKVAGILGVAVPTPAIAEASGNVRRQLSLMFLGVVLAVVVVGFILARRITAPILLLVEACKKVAAGELDQDVSVKAEDETGVLAHTFNQMLGGLRDRDFIRDTFGKYMSAAVSEAILSGRVNLSGERRVVTMLTSDIRSFTTLSETMEPEDLVAFLNTYFTSMVDCVVRYEGVVDKFIGDALVGIFGAPIPHEDDARRALMVALEMRKKMVEFNRYLEEGGHQPIRIGIGVHTGPVIAGNIGSDVKMEYSLHGQHGGGHRPYADAHQDLQD